MSEEGKEDQPFKVKDRRRFDAAGNERDDEPEVAAAQSSDEAAPAGEGVSDLPQIDFVTFILSLSTSVMMHLGEAPHPDGSSHADLQLARQSIDIIAMLRDKTSGNLTTDEQQLIDQLLYDLRIRYVQKQG